MKYFFSVDWGTSSLRVRFVGVKNDSIVILDEIANHYGCSHVYGLFEKEKSNVAREDFFLNFLAPYLVIPESVDAGEGVVPVVVSGMASSSIGIRELPYSGLPFLLDGGELEHEIIPRTEHFAHNTLLLSGLCDSADVMRGEEIQLLGLGQYQNLNSQAVFVFPGTHSKHIWIKGGQIDSFRTYITGEMFQILSTHSLLKNSIAKSVTINEKAFRIGVKLSKGNILNTVFSIRANSLLKKTEGSWNYSLLSGLLIGNELRELTDVDTPIYICAHGNLSQSYAMAFEELSIQQRCTIIPSDQIDESVVYGQKSILRRLSNNLNILLNNQ